MASAISTFDLEYDDTDPSSLQSIIQALLPSWKDAETQQLTGGVNNTLFKVTKKDQNVDGEAALVRVYGGSSGILVDREHELECHVRLQKHGLAPHIIGRFRNGYAYGFVPGKVCSPADLARESVWRGIARRMAEWHAALPLAEAATRVAPNIWKVLNKWTCSLSHSTEEEKTRCDELVAEAGLLPSIFCKNVVRDMPELVFAHCDLLAGNIVIKPGDSKDDPRQLVERVDFIDFEYAMSASATFDIACHFSEWAGFECDYTLLPSRSVRRQFLLEYMSTYNELCPPDGTIKDINELSVEVDKFRGVPGFLWGIAAFVQAQVSQVDFDFKMYGELRIAEYTDWKAEHYGTREKSGKKKPLREQMWAREE